VSRKSVLAAAVSVVALAAIGIWYAARPASSTPQSAPTPPQTAVPVVAATVTTGDVPIYLRGVGTVAAYNTDIVRSQIQGQITQIAFIEGQSVKAGDLLAQIDPRPYQAQIEQLTANLDRDKAQLKNAQTNLSRATQLGDKGYATQQMVENQQAQTAELESTVKADQAQIDQANVQLSYTRLTSPIPGITGVRRIDVGNVIHPTDTNGLVVVTQVEPISLLFTLPEAELPQIQQQMAKGTLKVIATSQDGKIKLDEGRLLLVDNEIAQATGTVQLKAEFPNAAHRLWPGLLVNAALLIDTRKDGLTIAASAVQQGPHGPYVYVVQPDSTAKLRPVKVAQIDHGRALIDTGLAANETVVIDGQYRLQDGSHVEQLHGKAAEQARLQSAVQEAIP
jgi:membrane fusion protein, multidrug efflux system